MQLALPSGISVIIFRQFMAWKPYMKNFLLLSVCDPLLWLYAMGVGVMGMFGAHEDYLLFVATGMVAVVISWSVVMDSLFGTMRRLENGQWRSVLATPTGLGALIFGEALFSATRGLIATVMVVAISYVFVEFPNPWGILPALGFVWIAGLALHGMCLCITAKARSYDDFDFVWPLFINPMFFFSGAFFTFEHMPVIVQYLVNLFPLAPTVNVVRGLLMGTAAPEDLVESFVILSLIIVLSFMLNYRLFQKRMYA